MSSTEQAKLILYSENSVLQALFEEAQKAVFIDGWAKQIALYRKIESVAKELNAEKELGIAITFTAKHYIQKGNFREGVDCIYECWPLLEKHNLKEQLSAIYNWLGVMAYSNGDYSTALDYYLAEIDFNSKANIEECNYNPYLWMGNIYLDLDELETADIFYSHAKQLELKYPESKHIKHSKFHLKTSIIVLKMRQDKYTEAEKLCKEILASKEEINDQRILPSVYNNLAMIAFDKGEPKLSLDICNEAEEYIKSFDIDSKRTNHRIKAKAYNSLGEYEKASREIDTCLSVMDKIYLRTGIELDSLKEAVEIYENANQHEKSLLSKEWYKKKQSNYRALLLRMGTRAGELIAHTRKLSILITSEASIKRHVIGEGAITIKKDDILFCQKAYANDNKNITSIFTVDKRKLRVYDPISSIRAEINRDEQFIMIHKSTFVNIKYVDRFHKSSRTIYIGDHQLNVSKSYLDAVANNFKLNKK